MDFYKLVSAPNQFICYKRQSHISFWIIARGLNLGLSTRMYFEDEAKKNHDDPVLTQIKELRRRDTLIAKREKADHYLFNIYLQGEDETIFFDI